MRLYTNGVRSLSHSIRTGSPRCSFDTTSVSSAPYAASTACSGVSSTGRSFSAMTILLMRLHFHDDGEGAALGILGHFLDLAHAGGLLLEGLGGGAVDGLVQLLAEPGQLALQAV